VEGEGIGEDGEGSVGASRQQALQIMPQDYKFSSFGLASNKSNIIQYYHYLLLHTAAMPQSWRDTFVQAFKSNLAQAALDHEPFNLLSATSAREVPQC
jgi:hypothetical protein